MKTLSDLEMLRDTSASRTGRVRGGSMAVALIVAAAFATTAAAATDDTIPDDQSKLQPLVNVGGTPFKFDWPMLRIGTAEYREGPTGVTVFRFGRMVLGAVDIRGEPATSATDWLKLGRDKPTLEAVVLSGGSFYGLESTTAVATAMKDDHLRSGAMGDVAHVTGAIIYDLGDRRLNEVYTDKRLAQAAFRGATESVFRNGSAGGGRMAVSGGGLGLFAPSGQGGAFFQSGNLKIAAFTVVNALGAVVDRSGRVKAGYTETGASRALEIATRLGALRGRWASGSPTKPSQNTTISLVVVNQKLSWADLQRLAIQVHTSMARGLQPYATQYDGDVLFAVSTGEEELPQDAVERNTAITLLPVLASEVMWDAILASVPEQPAVPKAIATSQPAPAKHAGKYRFSRFVTVDITAKDGKLFAQATGARDAYAIGRAKPVALVPVADTLDRFTVDPPSRYPLVLDFSSGTLVINPGAWAQASTRQ